MAIFPVGTIKAKTRTIKPHFIGFSTVDRSVPPFTLTNIELVKRDLMNHFMTPRGSRVMLPTYGTRIYQLLFDPFDSITQQQITDDAVNVVNSDPRVQLVDIDITREEHALSIKMTLRFVPENVTEELIVSYNIRNNS